eukprot:3193520-Prymnesium_polylepis.2
MRAAARTDERQVTMSSAGRRWTPRRRQKTSAMVTPRPRPRGPCGFSALLVELNTTSGRCCRAVRCLRTCARSSLSSTTLRAPHHDARQQCRFGSELRDAVRPQLCSCHEAIWSHANAAVQHVYV